MTALFCRPPEPTDYACYERNAPKHEPAAALPAKMRLSGFANARSGHHRTARFKAALLRFRFFIIKPRNLLSVWKFSVFLASEFGANLGQRTQAANFTGPHDRFIRQEKQNNTKYLLLQKQFREVTPPGKILSFATVSFLYGAVPMISALLCTPPTPVDRRSHQRIEASHNKIQRTSHRLRNGRAQIAKNRSLKKRAAAERFGKVRETIAQADQRSASALRAACFFASAAALRHQGAMPHAAHLGERAVQT